MLVLLVIFIIAAPLLNHAVKLDLPKSQCPKFVLKQPEYGEYFIRRRW